MGDPVEPEIEADSIRTVVAPISLGELSAMAEARFGNLVKAVVDIDRGVMVLDAEMHADEEALLLEEGSRQADLWGSTSIPTASAPGLHRVRFDGQTCVPAKGIGRARSRTPTLAAL
jgi:hypothetical protein